MLKNPFKKMAAAGVADTIKEGTKLIDEIFTSKEEKIEAKIELFKMTIADRGSARAMYEKDSWLQKSFALFFLVVWFALTIVILKYFVLGDLSLADWQIAFVSTIYGGMSTKLNTIVDFLFGGSSGGTNDFKIDK